MLELLLKKLDCKGIHKTETKDAKIILRFARSQQGSLEVELVSKEFKRVGIQAERLAKYSRRITIQSLSPKHIDEIIPISTTLAFFESRKKNLKKKITSTDIESITDLLRQKAKGTNYSTIATHSSLWQQRPYSNADTIKRNFLRIFMQIDFILKHSTAEEKSILKDRALLRPKKVAKENRLKAGFGGAALDLDYDQHPFIYTALLPATSNKHPAITNGADRSQFFFSYEKVLKHLPIIIRTSDHFNYDTSAEYPIIQIGKVLRRVCFESGGISHAGRKIYEYTNLQTGQKYKHIVRLGEEDIRGDARLLLAIKLFRELEIISSLDKTTVDNILAPFTQGVLDSEECKRIIVKLYQDFYPLVECMIFADSLPFEHNNENLLIRYYTATSIGIRDSFRKAVLEQDFKSIRELATLHPHLNQSPLKPDLKAHPIIQVMLSQVLKISEKKQLLNVFFKEYATNIDQVFTIATEQQGAPTTSKARTALMLAAEIGDKELVGYFLALGANIHIRDRTVTSYPHCNALFLAKLNGHQSVIDLLQKHEAILIEQPVNTLATNLIPGSDATILEDLNTVVKIISGSASLSVSEITDQNSGTKKLKFYINSYRGARPIHPYNVPIILHALGEQRLDDLDSANIENHASLGLKTFIINLDGQPHKNTQNIAFSSHDGFANSLAVLERLLQREIETIFVDAQNHFYRQQFNEPHPSTGKGATHHSVVLKRHKFQNFQIRVAIDKSYQVHIEIITKKDIQEYKNLLSEYLKAALDVDGKMIVATDRGLALQLTVTEFLTILHQRRINWSSIVILNAEGELLLANRVKDGSELGYTPPGGWHTSPYFSPDGAVQHAEEEFNLMVEAKDYQHIPMIGRSADQAIYLLYPQYWRVNSVSEKYIASSQAAKSFKAAENEFLKYSEYVTPINLLYWLATKRSIFLGEENALQTYLAYEEQNIKRAVHDFGIQLHAVNIQRAYSMHPIYSAENTAVVAYKQQASEGFGKINIIGYVSQLPQFILLNRTLGVPATLTCDEKYCYLTLFEGDFKCANFPDIVKKIQVAGKNKSLQTNFPSSVASTFPVKLTRAKKESIFPTTKIINSATELANFIDSNNLRFLCSKITSRGNPKDLLKYITLLNMESSSKVLRKENMIESNAFLITRNSCISLYEILKAFILPSKTIENPDALLCLLLDEIKPSLFDIVREYMAEIMATYIEDLNKEKVNLLLDEGGLVPIDEIKSHFLNCLFRLANLHEKHSAKKELLLKYIKLHQPAFDLTSNLTQLVIDKITVVTPKQMQKLFEWGADIRLGTKFLLQVAKDHGRQDLYPTIREHLTATVSSIKKMNM